MEERLSVHILISVITGLLLLKEKELEEKIIYEKG